MADDKSKQAVIIKRVKKGGHAAHGGAWKIAYADFVTAMMAFFLLLWLLNSVSQEQLEGISNYFAPTSISATTSGGGDILSGATVTSEGSAQSSTSRDSVTVDLPPPKAGTGGEDSAGQKDSAEMTDEEKAEELMRKKEEEQFEDAKKELEEAIEQTPELKEMEESLLIDNTPEGLRIQLMDKEGLAMFPSGSADMFDHTKRLLALVSKVVVKMPQQLSISGHTDSVPYVSDSGYSNWELSADRANAARRELVHAEIPFERVDKVVGKAAKEPFLPEDPKNARNRRLSIIMLRGTGRDKTTPEKKVEKKAKKKAKKKDKDETLPGLGAIRQRQAGEGLPAPKKEVKKTVLPVLAKPKVEPPKGLKLKLGPDEKGPALPGLEDIRQGKGKPAKSKAPPKLNLVLEPKKKALKPILPKPRIESTEGETLPGLDAIRRQQLEGSKNQ